MCFDVLLPKYTIIAFLYVVILTFYPDGDVTELLIGDYDLLPAGGEFDHEFVWSKLCLP